MQHLPTAFLSHGSPMTALDAGGAGAAWKKFADALPRPQSILMVSAHWETELPMLSGTEKPETIHDFSGFPEQLYRIRYNAPGSPDLARRGRELLKAGRQCAGIDGTRGLDHGAWTPLLHMYPEADVPVVQLSVQTGLGAKHHLALGQALAPLADEGVLIIGSGHMTHNLREGFAALRSANPEARPHAYVTEFQDWVSERIRARDTDALTDYRRLAPHAARAHPTEEHFLPLFVALGAAGTDYRPEHLYQEIALQALAMDAWAFR